MKKILLLLNMYFFFSIPASCNTKAGKITFAAINCFRRDAISCSCCWMRPSGATASLFLSKEKIPHVVIDKAVFPRDKVCGDGLSGKVVNILKKADQNLVTKLSANQQQHLPCYGVTFFAPNGKPIEIAFPSDNKKLNHSPGFVSRRMDFDHFLFQQLNPEYAKVITAAEVTGAEKLSDDFNIEYKNEEGLKSLHAKIIIAADGQRSVIQKSFFNYPVEDRHFCAGIRAYYKGVKGLHEKNFIELHFISDFLPGYFWIFPLTNGYANVGAGMLSSAVSEKKINLRQAMLRIIETHPVISKRFEGAALEGKIAGWGLPLGSKKRTLSDDGVILTGDAGCLIDPFTGEGIGNGMYSGMIAAQAASSALAANNFSKEFLFENYDQHIQRYLGSEFKLSTLLQKLSTQKWLFNFIANKSQKNETLRQTISCMFDDVDLRAKFRDPRFYFKLLFN